MRSAIDWFSFRVSLVLHFNDSVFKKYELTLQQQKLLYTRIRPDILVRGVGVALSRYPE
jgi:hypothetical protein